MCDQPSITTPCKEYAAPCLDIQEKEVVEAWTQALHYIKVAYYS
jgi:hypothetical protein